MRDGSESEGEDFSELEGQHSPIEDTVTGLQKMRAVFNVDALDRLTRPISI